MNILLLTEGDAERYDSWSGTAKSVVDHLRAAGHVVMTADVDLYGPPRWWAAARSFSPTRKRWGVRYHLGAAGYEGRSRLAAAAIEAHRDKIDCILQIGAAFEPKSAGDIPYALLCDSHIQVSLEGAEFGVSDTAWLRKPEFEAIRARESEVYRHAGVVFTISEYLRRSFIDDFRLPENKVMAVGAGPNLDIAKVPAPRPSARTGVPTILFVGKQFERKGGAHLLEAFRSVRARYSDARLVIVGPVTPPAMEPGVEYHGHLDKNVPMDWARMAEAYADADVFCLPTLYEPFGIVILEAMLFGLPCIGTAAWAIPEMIVEGQTGLTVPKADPAALADRICALLGDRDRAHRMGLKGRERALERFSWSAVVDRMSEGLQRCVAAGRR